MGRLFLIFALLCSGNALADRGPVFYPHLSAPAATAGNGKLAFQAFPGANGLQGIFLNALDVGITDYLEVGTAPVFYATPAHRYNYNAKLNFLKLRYLHLGVGYSYFAYRTGGTAPDGSPALVANYSFRYWFGAANLFLSDSVGLGVNVLKPQLKSDLEEFTKSVRYNEKTEWFVDLSLRVSPSVAVSPGFGVLRTETLNPDSPVPFGYGASLTWLRQRSGFLSRISLGVHHIPDLAENKFLFSCAFF